MAIINGQQFTEGDTVTVRNPLPTKMNVVRIADGEVDLSDGSQTVTARLETMPTPPPKRKA
ncbi:MAG TPA: hypothetical protein VM940_05770 [Chthoniobacterales bacterium]|jgi:hypothetical protein|nr:hypothetical protein [Chthoniobacterales bacterium]